MIRRMSKRFAALRAAAASTSGASWASVAIVAPSSDEDDVQDHDEAERHAAEQPHRAVPDLVALLHALWLGVPSRQAPHEAAQLLLGLRLGDRRNDDRHHRGGGGSGDSRPAASG